MKRTIAKPFLKWAGGKTQLIAEIERLLPKSLNHRKFTYVEPFVGSGAVLFWMLGNFSNLERAIISDVNTDLIKTYKAIAENPKELIEILRNFENEFHALEVSQQDKKLYYYQKREIFNTRTADQTLQAAMFIFLNRTCFNGLYRVNSKNQFNVPMGSYKKPTICNAENIFALNDVLQKVEILCGDFEETFAYATDSSLFYLDPPYKPLNQTASFNAYAKDDFNDAEQVRLKAFCEKLNHHKHRWILSNSDVKNYDNQNEFFDDLYADFRIKRVSAKRSINSNAEKRGFLSELLITNIPAGNESSNSINPKREKSAC